jgi:hypothetical protein
MYVEDEEERRRKLKTLKLPESSSRPSRPSSVVWRMCG